MIYKTSPIGFMSSHGFDSEILDFSGRGALRKIASTGSYIPENLQEEIRHIESAPDPNMVYLYDRALGAGEIYGPNNNGDWFAKDELQKHHGSFVKHAKLYRHHQNKNPANSVGDVLASGYNDKLETVDLIIRAPLEKVAADLQKLDSGKAIATSMGAKVKFDVCSICGNRARTRSAYCNHLKYEMLKMHDDGRQVFAFNPSPKFMDISIVVVPAAPESAILRKIASQNTYNYRGYEDSSNFYTTDDRGVCSTDVIWALSKMASHRDAVMTLHHAKGLVRPDEFVAILRKDASLLSPEHIPFVGYRRVGGGFDGSPNLRLSEAISYEPDMYIEKTASAQSAFYMTPDEKDEYLRYVGWCAHNGYDFKDYVR